MEAVTPGQAGARVTFRAPLVSDGLALGDSVAVDGACLTVRRLDAWHGSPVLDLKPYDDYDVVESPRVPAWWRARTLPGKGELR